MNDFTFCLVVIDQRVLQYFPVFDNLGDIYFLGKVPLLLEKINRKRVQSQTYKFNFIVIMGYHCLLNSQVNDC